MNPATFLDLVYGHKPDNTLVLVWTLPDKASSWLLTTQEAASVAERASLTKDVYVGVGLASRNYGRGARCPADEVVGIVALWADVDVLSALAHKNLKAPPTLDAARSLVAEMLAPPTILIDSGYGLHAWWLLREPWIFDMPAERSRAAALALAWNKTLQAKAATHGWHIDALGDLSRVLRIPGTKNHKDAMHPRDVTSLYFDPTNLLDAEEAESLVYAPEHWVSGGARPPAPSGPVGFILNPDAAIPRKLHLAMIADSKIRRTWLRERRDLHDMSASGWDLALANLLVEGEWSDQEIVDCLIAGRSLHGDDLKLRDDYYARTLARARAPTYHTNGTAPLLAPSEPPHTNGHVVLLGPDGNPVHVAHAPEHGPRATDERAALLGRLRTVVGIEIDAVIRYEISPYEWAVEAQGRRMHFGPVARMVNQKMFSDAVLELYEWAMPTVKPLAWKGVSEALVQLYQSEPYGSEKDSDWLEEQLTVYTRQQTPCAWDDEKRREGMPFFDKEGRLVFFQDTFKLWLSRNVDKRIDAREFIRKLKGAKCLDRKQAPVDKGQGKLQVWVVPWWHQDGHEAPRDSEAMKEEVSV